MKLESIRISEHDLCQWCASAWVVDDFLHNTANVAMSFCEVERSKLRWRFVEASMGRYVTLSVLDPRLEYAVHVLNMDPRPFLWLRITLPIAVLIL